MNFKFTIDDFLNDFGAGFILIVGLLFTNFDIVLTKIEYLNYIKDFGTLIVFFLFIFIYITGLAVSAISNFIDQDLYLFIDGLIRKTYTKEPKGKIKKIVNILINKPLYFLKMATFSLFFRRWSVIETILRLQKKFKKLKNKGKEDEIPPGLKFILDKTTEDIFQIEKKLRKELGVFDRHYYFKAQFWQIFSNSVLFVYIFNIFIFKNITFVTKNTLIYLFIFFLGKIMSPLYAKMYLRQMSRELKNNS
ncbi:hypothetical protein FACS189485_17200 [Spirochaetia bacterium]|nr:hypothetical protein FACS189485_17200 [Spirochaetia bacterium]